MRLERPPSRRPVGLTSLIDVIFLLLLFFMLATSFSRYQAMPVVSGQEGGGARQRPVLMRVHDGERLDVNGVALSGEELSHHLATLAASDARLVAIWTGEAASVQDLVLAIEAVREAGLSPVVLTGDR